jgi:glycosyltransferase involved in cell wall biosynthesis
MTGKKVLYILPQPFFLSRGSSFRALATVEELVKLGLEVDLLCYPLGNQIEHKGINIERIISIPGINSISVGPSFKKLVLDIPLFFKALYLCLTRKYIAIHGVEEGGILACCLGLALKIPYIFDMHSWMSEQIEQHGFIKSKLILNLFKKIELFCMRKSSGIITVGQFMTDLLKDMAPQVPAYTLNDLPLDLPTEVDSEVVEKIKEQYIGEVDTVLLYTGNFHSYQGIELLLRSFAIYLNDYKEQNKVKLLIVGGSQGELEAIAKYKNLAKELNIANNVIFCGEHPVEHMPAFIDCADLLISPRVAGNNVPLKIYTYLSSAKLILATDISSHTQVLNPDNSVLGEPTPQSFAKALEKSIHHLTPEQAEIIRTNAGKAGQRDVRLIDFRSTLERCYKNIPRRSA